MKPLFFLLGLLPALAFAAGTVEVTWQDPDHYSDIRPADESASRFRERVFQALEEQLEKLARKLPDGQRLEITFTDVDLAGEVRVGPRGTVRIIRDSQPARLEFSYRLLDSDGKVLREGRERLWGTLSSVSRLGQPQGETLSVSRALLSRWFDKNLLRSEAKQA